MPYFIRFVQIGLAVVGLLLLIVPVSSFPLFYAPRFMGVAAFLFAGLIALPALIFRPAERPNDQSVLTLQTTLAITLLFCGLGELGLWQLYRYGFEYDKLVHFVMPLAITLALSQVVRKRYGLRPLSAAVISGLFISLCGVLWEYAEFYNDKFFGTQLFGIYGADVYRDTVLDLLFNELGVIVAVAYLFFTRKRSKKNL